MPPMSSISRDVATSQSSSRLGVVPSPVKSLEKRASSVDSRPEAVSSGHRHRRRKSVNVTFSPTDELQEIPHINDLSDEEVADVWMTREELQAIRRQCATIVKFMDMDSAVKHGVCLRGLEQNTPSYVAVQVEIRQQLYDAVYAIQEFQLTTGMVVMDLLAETCQKFSYESVQQAHVVGLNDAMYVQSTLDVATSR